MERIAYSKQSLKALRTMQPIRAKAIIAKIEDYAAGRHVDARPMKGFDFVRIRVGQWRIIIDEEGTVITVMKIAPRGDVYK